MQQKEKQKILKHYKKKTIK